MTKPTRDINTSNIATNTPQTNRASVTKNPWEKLRCFTDARIGLGRTGISIPTNELLQFQLAHAKAQDAVHEKWDTTAFSQRLLASNIKLNTLCLHSKAENRETYLQRPDFGRHLSKSSINSLHLYCQKNHLSNRFDLAIIIADGLSTRAINNNAIEFLEHLLPLLHKPYPELSITPACLVQQGRVAVGDNVGQVLNADCSLVLIGERPGLSSPNSMGIYLTWAPRVGRNDSQRNCISNVRNAGLSYQQAADKTLYLFSEARARQLSGVQIKDRTDETLHLKDETRHNFQKYF